MVLRLGDGIAAATYDRGIVLRDVVGIVGIHLDRRAGGRLIGQLFMNL